MSRILIVDDEPSVTDGLVAMFDLQSIDAAGAYDRESAERMIAAEFFPLIVADLRLRTEKDGLLLLESIRRLSPSSRIASLTGYATPETESRLAELGASLVLHKPIGFEEVVALISDLLGEIEAAAATKPQPISEHDLEALYYEMKRRLYAIPQKRFGLTADEAEDLVQQAWCLYLERRATVNHAVAWLSGTVANLCRQQIQRNVRRRSDFAGDEDALSAIAQGPVGDAALVIRQALSRIDERSRDLCVLIGLEGWSYEEVCGELGIALGSVGPLYIRAKGRLKKAIERHRSN